MSSNDERIKKVKEGLNSDIYSRLDQLDDIDIDVNTPTDKLANILEGYLTKVDSLSFQEELKDLKILEEKDVELEVDEEELLRAYNASIHQGSTSEDLSELELVVNTPTQEVIPAPITQPVIEDVIESELDKLETIDVTDSIEESDILEDQLRQMLDELTQQDLQVEEIKEQTTIDITNQLEDAEPEVVEEEENVDQKIKELEKQYNDLLATVNLEEQVEKEVEIKPVEQEIVVEDEIKELKVNTIDLTQAIAETEGQVIEENDEDIEPKKEKKKAVKSKKSKKEKKSKKKKVQKDDDEYVDEDKPSKAGSIFDTILSIVLVVLLLLLAYFAYKAGFFDSLLGA